MTSIGALEDQAPCGSATLQHIALLKRKRERLHDAQLAAEEQFLHAVASAYNAGELGMAELVRAFSDYRAVAAPGFKNRWNATLPVSAARILTWHYQVPNSTAGAWEGVYPIDGGPAPRRNVCVVYVLFDAANHPCYVGSTSTFRDRLARHRRDGKSFVRWVAYPCKDREAAYELEERLLAQHKPYLNKKRGR